MVTVPAPVKQLFDTFPLATYPPVPNSTPEGLQETESNKFYFGGPTTPHHFTLAVHNVFILEGSASRVVPSDPVSLGQALILSYKNKLKLPRLNEVSASPNAIAKVSFHASPDNQLPILIEEQKEQRNIRTYAAINHSILSKNFQGQDPELLAINELIDTKLFDLWILTLLSEKLDEDTLSKLFQFHGIVGKLASFDLYQEIPNWQAFKIRHPELFD
ncbi:uncharacterized protein CANTADRAFT_33870, partial [Suhomyces tanzawaensis NRRL Y-17324]